MNKTLLAKSSSGESYEVYFTFDEGTLSVQCTCRAGMFRKLCKHKLGLISGDKSMLYDTGQEGDLAKIQDWLRQSPSLLELVNQLGEAEKELKKSQRLVKSIKKELEEAMKGKP